MPRKPTNIKEKLIEGLNFTKLKVMVLTGQDKV